MSDDAKNENGATGTPKESEDNTAQREREKIENRGIIIDRRMGVATTIAWSLVLVVVLTYGLPKLMALLAAKSALVHAQAEQLKEVTNTQRVLANSYVSVLEALNSEIRTIDTKLEQQACKSANKCEALRAIRIEKVVDRNIVLVLFGQYMVGIKKSEPNQQDSEEKQSSS